MSDELEPLGVLAARALAAERRRADVDSAMQERLLSRVVASVAVGAAVTGVAVGVKAAGGAATITAKVAGVVAVAAFVVGGVTGAAIHAAVAPSAPPPTPTVVVVPTPHAPQAAVVASDTVEVPSMPASALPSVPVGVSPPKPSASASASPDSDLAAERALIERARTAIGRGQPQDALTALDAHAARFPKGRLSEEREALAVDALARAGRSDDAKARAARFHATYPNSVFGAVVDAALAR